MHRPDPADLSAQTKAISWRKAAAISVVIMVCLTLQAGAVINGLFRFVTERGYTWPFLDYPMYKRSHRQGEPIDQFVLYGTVAGSTERVLQSADFDLNDWKFMAGPLRAMRNQDEENLRLYLELFRRRHHQDLVALRLETHPVTVGREGPISLPHAVLSTVELGTGEPRWEKGP
jgi:hypothetical protein